ncbi:hypothetical protein [Nocardioides deserti]|nr:hypothetical protein [Nocardioides deserti]GGO71650.1 hypothetical protein GCM10012276_13120 [Nocardioides deserti]
MEDTTQQDQPVALGAAATALGVALTVAAPVTPAEAATAAGAGG